jgi:hypothetical protein
MASTVRVAVTVGTRVDGGPGVGACEKVDTGWSDGRKAGRYSDEIYFDRSPNDNGGQVPSKVLGLGIELG